MKLKFWGTRGAIPTPSLATNELGGNTTCLQVSYEAGPSFILDCGTGIIELAGAVAGSTNREYHILVTHVHWDHIIGFPFFHPIHAEGTIIHFHSPFAGELLQRYIAALFDGTYSPLRDMANLAAEVLFHQIPPEGETIAGTEVRTCRTAHTAECYAYRLNRDGSALSFVMDHEAGDEPLNDTLVEFLGGSYVLVHEAQFTAEGYQRFRGWGHSSIEQAIDNALAARAEHLLLSHHAPDHSDDFLRLYLQRLRRARNLPGGTLRSLELASETTEYEF